MSDYDEPNMDDMINDYIADQEEGPPEYDEFDEAPDPYDFEEKKEPVNNSNNNNNVVMGDAAINNDISEPHVNNNFPANGEKPKHYLL